jgi:phospholipid/cholesterol/gamma-HCH transport system permease protein
MSTLFDSVSKLGAVTRKNIDSLGLATLFLLRIVSSLFTGRVSFKQVIKQIYFIGNRSLIVIIVAALFTGMVVALQFYDTLVRFGSVDLLGSAVALSLIKELGPVMTALMVIARVGSATCSEIGIMRNEQQFDALDCMAINSYRYVMLPRLLAALICVPILTAVFDLVGIGGGYIVGIHIQGESPGAYIQGVMDTISFKDVLVGQIKSLVFGLFIMWIPLYYGYYLHRNQKNMGAEGVSNGTTQAVVMSAIIMLFSDYIVSSLAL